MTAAAPPWLRRSNARAASSSGGCAQAPLRFEARCSSPREHGSDRSAWQAPDSNGHHSCVEHRTAEPHGRDRDAPASRFHEVRRSYPAMTPGCTPPSRPPSDLAGDDHATALICLDVLNDDGLLPARSPRRKADSPAPTCSLDTARAMILDPLHAQPWQARSPGRSLPGQ